MITNPVVKKILLTLAAFSAFVLAAILYSFIDSRVSVKPELDTPAAYGVDSLEYEAPPVMYLTVWQRNDKDSLEYDIEPYSPFYFEKTELILREGETILSITNPTVPFSDTFKGLTFTIDYNGTIQGQYDIHKYQHLYYGGNSDMVPRSWSGTTEFLTNSDSAFSGVKSVTFNVLQYSVINEDRYTGKSNMPHEKYVDNWLSKYEVSDTFDRENFCVLQSFHEVYPDAPEVLADYERSITTTCLTINAMHPTKKDIVIATAVIQIKTYSTWYSETQLGYEDLLLFKEYPNVLYSEISVKSYEQSDSFAWEQ